MPNIVAGIVIAVLTGGIGAAIVAGWISHRTKISEFRQLWIDGLRRDIADFTGTAQRWSRLYNHTNPDRTIEDAFKLNEISSNAWVIFRRIQLRLNPRDNQYKKDDDAFLVSLKELLNPAKLGPEPQNTEFYWDQLADNVIEKGREILKREWEVTKRPIRAFWCSKIRRY